MVMSAALSKEAPADPDYQIKVRKALSRSTALFIKQAPPQCRQQLSGMARDISVVLELAHGALYGMGAHEALDPNIPLLNYCNEGLRIARQCHGSEEAKAAELGYEAASFLLVLLNNVVGSDKAVVAVARAAHLLGSADVRLQQVLSGMWDIVAAADQNASIADGRRAAQSAGGKAVGKKKVEKAAEWKAEYLPEAERLSKSYPHWTRSKLATEILQRFDRDTPGHRQVEIWLKDEAEQPNGPLPSRARRSRTRVS